MHKRHFYLSGSTLTSKNISRTLFVVCLSVNMFFVPFSGILTCKCINDSYPVAVYTLNTRRIPYCLFLTTENVPFIFDAAVWTSKHQGYLFSILKTSKYVLCLILNTSFLLVCCNLICNCMSGTYVVAVYCLIHQPQFPF